MEKSFDFGRLLRNHEKKHKIKPTQFVSLAEGVKKRLESNLKQRKSSRLTVFDSVRNLSRCASPAAVSGAQLKVEHRRQQLEKWKEDKEKKKKEAASQKKKPFVAGVPHAPLNFVPPPPPPAKPSTSGRVTRSQAARNSRSVAKTLPQMLPQSFAPKNASFKPPELKTMPKVPYVNIVALKPIPTKKKTFTFDPVSPKTTKEQKLEDNLKQTRSRAQNKQKTAETKPIWGKTSTKSKRITTKPSLEINTKMVLSSSSSETDSKSPIPRRSRSRKSLLKPQHDSTSKETDTSSQSPEASPSQPSPVTRSRKSLPSGSPILVSRTPRKSFTPKNPLPKSESSSEERLRSPECQPDVRITPKQIIDEAKKISPCVTISRGKDNARREMKKKIKEGLLDEDLSDGDNLDHFRRQLASEIKRIADTCDTWDRILEQTALPDFIQELVLGAVGQARLLMAQKLKQFGALVERCARPEPGAALVTPADLQGFWDMVFMQVENVDMRFKKLEEYRARGWQEEATAPPVQKRAQPRAKAKPSASSRIKDMIAAARKARKQQAQTESEPSADSPERTFEAGFFCVRSPARSPAPTPAPAPALTLTPAPATPARAGTLLKAVLSNEAKKSATRNSASFAMLRASVLGKNLECEGIAPLPQTPLAQVNINATPGRSILKHATDSKKSLKSKKAVVFDQSDGEADTSLSAENPKPDRKPEIENHSQNVLEPEFNADSGLSSMDVEKEEKENSRRKSRRITRQDATEERSPVMTRSRRKSGTPRAGGRRSAALEERTNVMSEAGGRTPAQDTPKRAATRRRNDLLQQFTA